MKSRNNYLYFLLALFLTSSLMLVKKTNILQKIKEFNIIRNLALDNVRTYSCDKAGSRLTDKYQGDFDEETGDPKESLSDAQQSIVDFIRETSYHNIKPYLKRVGIFITFLVIAVIFIILWITYCSCCCCNCCLFSKVEEPNKTMQLILFIISAGCCLLVIVFSIVVLALISPFFSRLNGLCCSTMTLLHHLSDGLSPQYPPHANEWLGLSETSTKFSESDEVLQDINYDKVDELYEIVKDKCAEEGAECVCNASGVDIEGDYGAFNLIKFIFVNLGLPGYVGDLISSKKIIDDSINDTGEDIYDFLHDYGNKHIKNSCIAVFVLTLIFGILNITCLCLYYILKKEYFRIAYIVLWNISMLFMILAIVVSAIYGVLGYVCKDGVQVLHYAVSTNNLESNDPIIFTSKSSILSTILDICANGDGHFIDILGEGFSDLDEGLENDTQDTIDILYNNTCNNDTRDYIVRYYNEIYNVTSQILKVYADLFNISCAFAKNDKNIILNELKSAGNRAIVMSAFQFLIGIFLGFSILAGILFVHKYNLKKELTILNTTADNRENTTNTIDDLGK